MSSALSSATLARARAGDDHAFRELTAPHLPELHLHCYRMLGSLTDADDVLQEVLVAAWRGLGEFAGRSSLRTWLYRIATNRCLNEIRAGKRRVRSEPLPPFDPLEPSRRSEVTWLQPYPDTELDLLVERGPGLPAGIKLARRSSSRFSPRSSGSRHGRRPRCCCATYSRSPPQRRRSCSAPPAPP